MSKKVSVNVEFNVGDSVSEAEVLKRLEKSLSSIVRGRRSAKNLENVEIGNVAIKTGARVVSPSGGASGYEARIWEKATCCVTLPERPEDLVTFPEITPVLPTDKLVQGVTKLQTRRLALEQGVGGQVGGGLQGGARKAGSKQGGAKKAGARTRGGKKSGGAE